MFKIIQTISHCVLIICIWHAYFHWVVWFVDSRYGYRYLLTKTKMLIWIRIPVLKQDQYGCYGLIESCFGYQFFFKLFVYCRFHWVRAISRLAKFNGWDIFINHRQSAGTWKYRSILAKFRIEPTHASFDVQLWRPACRHS